jgi:hypothetical protein
MHNLAAIAGFTGLALLFLGEPRMLVTYEYQPGWRGGFSHYTKCDYLGVSGWTSYFPETMRKENCPYVKLFPVRLFG